MAKSKKPRKPYQRPNFAADAARLNPEKYAPKAEPVLDTPALKDRGRALPEKGSEEARHFSEQMSRAKMPEDTVRFLDPPAKKTTPRKPRAPKAVPIDKEPPAPAHPHVVHPTAPRALSGRGRYLVPVAAGAGVIGGGAFLAHRARQRKATMTKALVNPLTGSGVTFEKRYIEDEVDNRPRGALVAKRSDMSALEHTGSRRLGRLPVSSVKVSGLPVQSASFSRGNAEARPGTRSQALKHTHIHTNVKAPRTGKLFVLHHRSRSKSPAPIHKSAGYAQSGGSGRRLVNF